MFLTYHEIMKSKKKFFLIICALNMVTLLIFVLNGMSNGLDVGINGAIRNLKADLLIYQEGTQLDLLSSQIDEKMIPKVKSIDGVQEVASLGFFYGSTALKGKDVKLALIGYQIGRIGEPSVIKGIIPKDQNELNVAVVDNSLAAQYGLRVGDKINIKNYGNSLKIVGITTGNQISMMPAVYIPLDVWKRIRAATTLGSAIKMVGSNSLEDLVHSSVLLVKAFSGRDINSVLTGIQEEIKDDVVTRKEAAMAVKGAAAMKIVMIILKAVAYIIGFAVIGVFCYILTLQKTNTFGILKALGASELYLVKDLLLQVSFLALVSSIIGIGELILIKLQMPPIVAFKITPLGIAISLIGIFAMAISGAMLSLRHIIKIEPVSAMVSIE